MPILRTLVLALMMIALAPGVARADMPPWLTCGGCGTGSGRGVLVLLLLVALVTYCWSRRRRR